MICVSFRIALANAVAVLNQSFSQQDLRLLNVNLTFTKQNGKNVKGMRRGLSFEGFFAISITIPHKTNKQKKETLHIKRLELYGCVILAAHTKTHWRSSKSGIIIISATR